MYSSIFGKAKAIVSNLIKIAERIYHKCQIIDLTFSIVLLFSHLQGNISVG